MFSQSEYRPLDSIRIRTRGATICCTKNGQIDVDAYEMFGVARDAEIKRNSSEFMEKSREMRQSCS
jgi:hypothetical protein